MSTPWDRARKLRSSKQEDRISKLPVARKQVNSGRFWRWHRDAIVWNFLVEARTTEDGSYRISEKEFHQIRREAIMTPPGLKPAMQVDVGKTSLWVMELRDWEDLYVRLVSLESQLDD